MSNIKVLLRSNLKEKLAQINRSIRETLASRARTVFEFAEPLLPLFGIFTITWHIFAYVIWAYILPEPYESLWMRIIQILLATPFLFYDQLKRLFSKLYPPFYVFFVLFATPFFLSYMTMKNEWSVVWAMTTLCVIVILILIGQDWLLICTLFPIAYALAYLLVLIQDGSILYLYGSLKYLPVYLFSITGSILATGWVHLRHEKKISLMKSLSATIAHEMRNPLNSITLAIDSVKDILPAKTDEKKGAIMLSETAAESIRTIIDRSSETIGRSNKIIDTILASLNGSEIDRTHFRFNDTASTIHAAVDSYGFETHEERSLISLHLSNSFEFLGDRDLFTHMLFNLIGNALYYREKPGFRIDITTRTDKAGNSITVRDTGIGVPADKREKIFTQFYTSGKAGGNGLGLAFCRRVAESFGGSIVCRSQPGAWTEFVITLPAADSKRMVQLKRELLAGRKVLLVDDQSSNCLLLSRYLSEMNCKTDQAENGEVAIDLTAKTAYDLIFMNIGMPVLNGDDAAKCILEGKGMSPSLAAHYQKIPIIGITALPEEKAAQSVLHWGMAGYLLKPVDHDAFDKLLDRCFFRDRAGMKNGTLHRINGNSILLVDDNITSREFIKLFLAPMECRVYTCANGKQAIELIENTPVDLIIMDLEMPVMNGIETTKIIRKGVYNASVPIISLSGHTDQDTIKAAMEAGINLHLGKPIRRAELIEAMASLLRHSESNLLSEDSPPTIAARWHDIETTPLLDEAILDGLRELGEPEWLRQLFELFIRDTTRLIAEFDSAYRQNDKEQARKIIHTLMGSAANIGADKLRKAAVLTNDLIQKNGCSEGDTLVVNIRELFSQTIQAFSDSPVFLSER